MLQIPFFITVLIISSLVSGCGDSGDSTNNSNDAFQPNATGNTPKPIDPTPPSLGEITPTYLRGLWFDGSGFLQFKTDSTGNLVAPGSNDCSLFSFTITHDGSNTIMEIDSDTTDYAFYVAVVSETQFLATNLSGGTIFLFNLTQFLEGDPVCLDS